MIEIVERNNAVGDVTSEAANMAHGEDLGRDRQGKIEMIAAADATAHNQRIGADAAKRRNDIGPTP